MSWEIEYKKKLRTPEEALRCVQSGMRVYIHPGCAEPETLVDALIRRAPFVQDVEIVHMMTMGRADYVAPEMASHFRHNAVFIGGNVREAMRLVKASHAAAATGTRIDLQSSVATSLIGMVLAFFAGLVALRWLSSWLEEGRWYLFGIYCVVASGVVFYLYHIGI